MPKNLLTMQTAQQLVSSNLKLVTLPAVFARVKSVVDDRKASAIDLAKVLSGDPAMTARVLQLVNSAFWGFGRRIESLSRAVSLLGMLQVHDLVLASSVAQVFDRVKPALIDVKKHWRGSVLRGLAATELARRAELVDLGRVFTEGLLSDMGHMVLYMKTPELAARALEQTLGRPWDLAQAERELIGCDAAQVGGALCDAWNLPQCFGESIRHQSDPRAAGTHALEASLLHIAAALAASDAAEGGIASAALERVLPFAWQTLGVDADCAPEVLRETGQNLSSTLQMLSAPLARAA